IARGAGGEITANPPGLIQCPARYLFFCPSRSAHVWTLPDENSFSRMGDIGGGVIAGRQLLLMSRINGMSVADLMA
ncbi:MAG: hypothetical protein VW035_07380, partial [Luminiphilus sp.]